MTKARVIKSGSSGNGIAVMSDDMAFGLDCGVSLKDYKIALDFSINRLKFMVCTHGHS